ncbi:hypothetical protein [Bradyrhizobium sp. SYSU BS000235]|uniref:hypothetical protein n=1 Tax=Bradyrhizobium sp. SYSU BS000235 TaxID=3411332 RepID=UPI003C72BEE5
MIRKTSLAMGLASRVTMVTRKSFTTNASVPRADEGLSTHRFKQIANGCHIQHSRDGANLNSHLIKKTMAGKLRFFLIAEMNRQEAVARHRDVDPLGV